ncbi:MAG: IscA/HesB family protein [Deltaproteobacteria bacterium]|nr:IscA/HesB family protein [Deltaproteobacteria bacterium]
MLEVTDMAQKKIADYFKDKELEPVRILLQDGGCGGPSLNMGLDEAKDTDNVYDLGGIQYLVDKNLMGKAKFIKVDFGEMGFKLTSRTPLGGGGCSGCGSSGSCS